MNNSRNIEQGKFSKLLLDSVVFLFLVYVWNIIKEELVDLCAVISTLQCTGYS